MLADTVDALVKLTAELKSSVKELMATGEYISKLHVECHWLIKYFAVCKQARAGELEALGKAKAELSAELSAA